MDGLDYLSDDDESSDSGGEKPIEKESEKDDDAIGGTDGVRDGSDKSATQAPKRRKVEHEQAAPLPPPPPPLSPPRRKISLQGAAHSTSAAEAPASGLPMRRTDAQARGGLVPVQLLTRRSNVPTEDLSALGLNASKK